MRAKPFNLYSLITAISVTSASLLLAACQNELAYLNDEDRYDCTAQFDNGDDFKARYIVNKKSGNVHESISLPRRSMNKLTASYIRKDQISAIKEEMVGPIKITNQATITPSMTPIGFTKWVGAKGGGVSVYGECTLVKLDRKKVLAGRREYQALEKRRENWFKACERELRNELKDPSSYSYVSHTAFGGTNGNKKYVDIKYRAKNSFGATVVGKYSCTS